MGVKICKGDSITWLNNKGGPHNVVFVEDAIPKGVSAESISMDDQLGDEGDVHQEVRHPRQLRVLLRAPRRRWHEGRPHRRVDLDSTRTISTVVVAPFCPCMLRSPLPRSTSCMCLREAAGCRGSGMWSVATATRI